MNLEIRIHGNVRNSNFLDHPLNIPKIYQYVSINQTKCINVFINVSFKNSIKI